MKLASQWSWPVTEAGQWKTLITPLAALDFPSIMKPVSKKFFTARLDCLPTFIDRPASLPTLINLSNKFKQKFSCLNLFKLCTVFCTRAEYKERPLHSTVRGVWKHVGQVIHSHLFQYRPIMNRLKSQNLAFTNIDWKAWPYTTTIYIAYNTIRT